LQPLTTSLGKAPSLPVLAGVCGSLLFYDMQMPLLLCPLAGILVTAGIVFLSSGSVVKGFWYVLSFAILFSMAISCFCLLRVNSEQVSPGSVHIKGYVAYERPWGSRRAIIISSSGSKYVAFIPSVKGVKEGDGIEMNGIVLPFRRTSAAKGGFREDLYWKARGVVSELIPESMKILSPSRFSIHYWRTVLRMKILLSVPEKTRGYVLASWLGIKDPDLVKSHSAFGTVHLLAVSGFHVAMVASGLFFLFRNMAAKEILISMFLWIYVALTGFSASALRAALMLQLILLSSMIGRPVAPINSVSVAGILMLIMDPYCFWNLGWRLSMVASMTIAAVAEIDVGNKIRCILIAPLVWITTSGLVVSAFGRISLAGIILNMAAIPLFGILLPLASVLVLWGILGLPFAGYLFLFSEIPFNLWERIANLFSPLLPYVHIPAGLVVLPSMFVFLFLLFLVTSDKSFSRSLLASGTVISFMAFISGSIMV